MAAKIKIKDLPKDEKVSKEELKKISGGLSITPVTPDEEITDEELRKISGGVASTTKKGLYIDCW